MAGNKIKSRGIKPEDAKKSLENATGMTVVQPILYSHDRGRVTIVVHEKPFIFERNLNRILECPDPSESTACLGRLWGGGNYTSDELKKMIPQLVAEGMQIKDVLKELPDPMPSTFTVKRWEMSDSGFKDDMLAARAARAELMVDAATDDLLRQTDPDDMKVAKGKAEHIRWMAERMNQQLYAKTTNVNIEDKTPAKTAQESEARLERMLKHPVLGPYVRGMLEKQSAVNTPGANTLIDITPDGEL